MKLVCPNCGAKYQIADERVAGRSLKMKCRKCGDFIRIAGGATTKGVVGASEPPTFSGMLASVPPSAPPSVAPPGGDHASLPPGTGASVPPPLPGPRPRLRAELPTRRESVETEPGSAPADGVLAGAFAQVEVPESAPPPTAAPTPDSDWYVGVRGIPIGPVQVGHLFAKARAGAVTARSLVWREGFDGWKPLGDFPELVAVVEEAQTQPSGPSPPTLPPEAVADTKSVSPRAAGHGGRSEVPLEVPKRRTSVVAWLAVLVALAFGITVGFVLFSGDARVETIIRYVEVAGSAESMEARSAQEKAPAAGAPEAREDRRLAGSPPGRGAGRGLATKGDPEAAGSTQGGLSGLRDLGGVVSGPKADPMGATSPVPAGQPLDSAQVQGTVARYRNLVQRGCWQPALAVREKDAPSTARVSVSIQVAPSGAVTGVSTGGDPRGYRGLASCIGSRVKGWRFPPSSGPTTVNVPFVFAAQ